MHKSLSLMAALLAALTAATWLLAGCGGSGGLPNDVAVRIGSHIISRATIEHWLPIETYLAGHDIPKTPPPKGLIPDPPLYTACIGYERNLAAEETRGVKLSLAQLKSRCQSRWKSSRTRTINNLILNAWLLDEASERGIKVGDQEVREAMNKNVHHLFKTSAAFHQYLSSTKQTEADELERTRTGLVAYKFYNTVILHKGGGVAYTLFIKKWVAKTDCAPGYVIPDCKQYKGPLLPLGMQG